MKRQLMWLLAATSAVVSAANPPVASSPAASAPARAPVTEPAYVPLGTSPFGPNGHGSYAWFIEVKSKQVVMCLVHNPQSPIECKRAPLPAATSQP